MDTFEIRLMKRFMDKVMPEPMSGCWLWVGGLSGWGYGYIDVKDHQKRAHRVSFELFKGPIPDGLFVCHACDVKSCVNPDHLFLGTHQDNMDDCHRKGGFDFKTTEIQINIIREAKIIGHKAKDIARYFRLTETYIHQIIKNKRRTKWMPLN